jgi:hypothetical protein
MGTRVLLGFLAAVALAAAPAAAQKGGAMAPVCPYCKDDPKIQEKAGLGGHGAMPFGKTTADDVRRFLSYAGPIFLESQHFRIGMTLEGFQVPEKDFKRMEAELTELKKKLPLVNIKTRFIDPWLRIHLYAQRSEERYQRFLGLLQMKDSDFYKRAYGQPYRGEGTYFGMKDKYEIVMLRDLRQFKDLLRDQTGSTTSQTKRDHFVDRGVLSVFIPLTDEVREDYNMWASVAHNLGHNFVLGYRYYSYEPPKWFEEGFAHFFEKEVSEDFNSFDSEEAAIGQMYTGKDWREGTLGFLARGKAPSTADLIHKKGLSDLGKEDHVIVWSKVEFMIKQYPTKFRGWMDTIHGRLGANDLPDGSNLPALQREFIKNELGLSLPEFDKEWEKWVQKTYVPK